jgi:hypothetical protein
MGALKGFPNPPALWLRRVKPVSAHAIMGTLKGFASLPAPANPRYYLPDSLLCALFTMTSSMMPYSLASAALMK